MSPKVHGLGASALRSGRSFYEDLRGSSNRVSELDDQGDLQVDEDNWNRHFHEQDLEHIGGLANEDSRITLNSAASLGGTRPGNAPSRNTREAGAAAHAPRWTSLGQEEDGNDVPRSLLVERQQTQNHTRGRRHYSASRQATSGQNSSGNRRAQWDQVQNQQKLHPSTAANHGELHAIDRVITGSAREKALWRWINVTNLDVFMKDVYEYYLGSGFWCIVCERALHLIQSTFIVIFLTFLTQCIDYAQIPDKNSLSEVFIPQCTKRMPWYWNVGLWLFVFYLIWKSVQFSVDTGRLLYMRHFYTYLLEIPEQDMQTVSWQDVVARVMALRDANPSTALNMTPAQRQWLRAHSKERLDAVDIASRLMRKDNYLIAMINKDIMDMTLPIPFLRKRQFFSGTLQWWLYFSIIDFVFDHSGQVNQEFLKTDRRGLLSRKLRERFIAAGILNLLCTPFWIGYQAFIHLLNYYNEYRKNSATLGDRRYTALARWKFREFNELPHLFQGRLNMSYPFASRYIDQFPKRLTEQVARCVTFISGAITFVLTAASFLDNELILRFEITKDRTALFYIGVFGTIWALARGMISEETTVFDPEFALKGVLEFTHYMPDHWRGRLHSSDVKNEFSELYKLKVVNLIEEIAGIFLASMILLFSAPKSSEQIIDFFREFTIHVDGLGYVCSFAEFDFNKWDGNSKKHTDDAREDYYSTKHGKMAASYYGFLENYVVNPKTGMPGGHVPPSLRHQFQPPPAFPGLNSPTLAGDVQSFRPAGRNAQPTHPSRFGPSATAPSPMGSVLLDPHHQPQTATIGVRGGYPLRNRGPHGEGQPERIFEESSSRSRTRFQDGLDEDVSEGGGPLGDSVWQTSPAKTISRENSEAEAPGQETGVLGLIQQLQQANRDNRLGGMS